MTSLKQEKRLLGSEHAFVHFYLILDGYRIVLGDFLDVKFWSFHLIATTKFLRPAPGFSIKVLK